ncbi:zf-TFIIB domain-containing protein [Lysinibacter sp. HNR]|uniref:TFIIB-type zinc ribbon-containing protein n=1 Tax=Lysinibacter sp. HNR TaxID=3031408 RepID=UPI002436101C|nr:zf-TFIIB domain-containing protein [Lysinibacter sp. HNR]WGD36782.1 zf-TFIIB domain-containing protein [Lysinibacter sp. HNR]
MECPVDKSMLLMSERNGIEIDYCPQCRGVWLDRGEIDKIIERSAPTAQTAEPVYQKSPQQRFEDQYDSHRKSDYRRGDGGYGSPEQNGQQGGYRKKKRESWLGELFDM